MYQPQLTCSDGYGRSEGASAVGMSSLSCERPLVMGMGELCRSTSLRQPLPGLTSQAKCPDVPLTLDGPKNGQGSSWRDGSSARPARDEAERSGSRRERMEIWAMREALP